MKPAFLVHPGQDLRGAGLSALSKGIKQVFDTTKEPMVYGQRVGMGGTIAPVSALWACH